MQYNREFLNLRERLNHSYVTPRLLMAVKPDAKSIKNTFENPKIWHQIKLRIHLLFDIGENIFKLECPEVFGRIKKELDSIIRGIDEIRLILKKDREICQQAVDYSYALSNYLNDMAGYEYVTKYDQLIMHKNQKENRLKEIREGCQILAEKIVKSMKMEGGWEKQFLELGKKYWHHRIFLEKVLIEQMVIIDRQRMISGKKFWDALYILIDTDAAAEELLALEISKDERQKRMEILLSEKNSNSIRQYFKTIENKLINFLEV
ncbi:MAG: hypothetical protein JSV88_07920 [Candidatus Aminicenantes bacterium]|nr:MAG: hypothetical protein JSV88_07920 [Candidatus Aminicenantes bacterium]